MILLARKMNSAQNMNPAIGFNATLTFITYPEKGACLINSPVDSLAYHCTRQSPDLKDSKRLLGLNVFKKVLKIESSLAKHLIFCR